MRKSNENENPTSPLGCSGQRLANQVTGNMYHPTSQGKGLPLPLSLPMAPKPQGLGSLGSSFFAKPSVLHRRRARRLRPSSSDANVDQLW